MSNFIYEVDHKDISYARNRVEMFNETLSKDQILELFEHIEYENSHNECFNADQVDEFEESARQDIRDSIDQIVDKMNKALEDITSIKALKLELKPLINKLLEI